jgi:pimeloyl-ACP methyl ester carboxylesterase
VSGRLHVERRGDGPGVVFTHGLADSSLTWSAQLSALADEHTVVAWDMRGHGRSDPPVGPYRRDDALEDLTAVAAMAGHPVTLVGHSLGGYLSLLFALRHPERVAGLVVVSAGPGFRNPARRARYNRLLRGVAQRHGLPPDTAAVAYQDDAWVIERLPSLACPLLAIVGSRDDAFYHDGSRYIAEHVAGAKLLVVSVAGHPVHSDEPARVNAALRAFLAEVHGALGEERGVGIASDP